MNSRIKAIIGLVLLFAAGLTTGIVIAPRFQKHDKAKPFPAAEWEENTVREYRARLGLNADEERHVREAATVAADTIVQVRGEAQQRIQAAIKGMNRSILPALDTESRDALLHWLEEKRAAMKAH